MRWTPEDRVLWTALAEGLGYGRDWAALRACGERIAADALPDALLGEALRLPRVEGLRLRGLAELGRRWEMSGPWAPLRRGDYNGIDRWRICSRGAVAQGGERGCVARKGGDPGGQRRAAVRRGDGRAVGYARAGAASARDLRAHVGAALDHADAPDVPSIGAGTAAGGSDGAARATSPVGNGVPREALRPVPGWHLAPAAQ
jgi:hypothetical protein